MAELDTNYIKNYHKKREILKLAYLNKPFLAEKLKDIFVDIKSENDRYIHNDTLDDIVVLVGNNHQLFLERIAQVIMDISLMPVKIPVKKSGRDIGVHNGQAEKNS
jgi:hypothetical protein